MENNNTIEEILAKVKVPEEYQENFIKFIHLFNAPQIVKLVITDRISGKTTSKILDVLAKIMMAIEKKEILPQFIWLRRDWHDSIEKVMDTFRKAIRLFFVKYWQGKKKVKDHDFEVMWGDKEGDDWKTIYRGVFYKKNQVIFFYDLYNDEASRGAIMGNIQEIIFDEFMPTHPSKYLSDKSTNKGEETGLTEEIMFSEMWSGAYRTDKETPTKLLFLGNPYDRFNYALKNWENELEEWANWHHQEQPALFTLQKVKELPDGDELIYLRKFEEKRKELHKFDSRDYKVWDRKFFASLESLNMIKIENQYLIPVELYFNDTILAKIKGKNNQVLVNLNNFTPGIKKTAPGIIFTNEEHLTCPQTNKWWRKSKDIAHRWTKLIADKKLAFRDFESRTKAIDFIIQNKTPYNRSYQTWGIKDSAFSW
jgi:hypothetical protein